MYTIFSQYSFVEAQDSTISNNSNMPRLKDASLRVERVLSGLDSPTNIAFLKNNDFLILEKNGTVQRAINGIISDKPLLRVNVSNGFYQGMLGIAIAPSNRTNNDITPIGNNDQRR